MASIDGDYWNVVGLPVALCAMLAGPSALAADLAGLKP